MSATLAERIEAPAALSAWDPYPTLYEINTWVWAAKVVPKPATKPKTSDPGDEPKDAFKSSGPTRDC